MPPKYSSNSYRNSNNRNSHHHTPSTTTPITPTPSSGVPISNKTSTQTTTDPSRIIPQPRRRRSSVNREQQSSPSGESEHTTTSPNTTNGSINHSTTVHNNNTTSAQNNLDDDCENQAGLATNAIEKIFSTTLQFNADSILSAVDLLQQRRGEQFPNEKRKRFTIREILEVGSNNPICNDRHNDLPDLDYRKLDWGITPVPPKGAAELAKRPSRQTSGTNQIESLFGSKSFSGRGRSLSRENNAIPSSNTSNTSSSTITNSSLGGSRFASSAISNSSSTVMRTSGKGALWFDEVIDTNESNPLELTNEEIERKKAFEEFRKIHHATVGAGSFFDFGGEEGESLESGPHTSFDDEALEEPLEPTSLDEMAGSNASDLENYFNTLSTGGNQTQFGGIGATSNFMSEASLYPKEHHLNEIEDEFINLPTPKSMLAPQKRDKPLFALDDSLNKEPVKPVHKEDSVISSVLQNKSGKSRFGFGDGFESDIQPQQQQHSQPLPFTTNNGGSSKFLNINNQPIDQDQAILPIHHQTHTGGGATINVTALFGGSSVMPTRKQSNPIHHEAFNNFAPTTIEKHPEEEINHNIHLEQFPVIDASNQISMMSAEDLELQFLKSLNDTNQPSMQDVQSEANKMNQTFKPISNDHQNGLQEVSSQQSTSQFVSPFQKYQEQKQNEKSETKLPEELSLTPSKQSSVSKTSTNSPASTTQRKLSKTSANSPFVPSHLMKKMGTNTEKKIKLKVSTPVTNTAPATKTATSQPSNANSSSNITSTTANVASVQPTVETQQSPIINQQQMPMISQNEYLSQNNMAHMNLNPSLLPPNGNHQPPVSPTIPMNMGMPMSPLMNQNQPPMRILQKPPNGFVPSQPYPNSPTFIPFNQGHPVHPGIPAGFIPPNGNMFPNGFIPNNGMFQPHPNMFMGNQQQDFSQALSLEDLEKELMNQK